jgi:hypothetical protein
VRIVALAMWPEPRRLEGRVDARCLKPLHHGRRD